MRTIRVNVTQRDIDRGEACDSGTCPVARAVLRVKGVSFVAVAGEDISINTRRCLLLPKKVSKFIERFDDGQPVKPFTFVLVLP